MISKIINICILNIDIFDFDFVDFIEFISVDCFCRCLVSFFSRFRFSRKFLVIFIMVVELG